MLSRERLVLRPYWIDVPDERPFHVLLLRHGQTDANAMGILQGHQPTPLNALGLLQAQRLAEGIGRRMPKVTAIVSSDLRRAVQTTQPVAAACGLAPVYDADWRERAFGTFEGRSVGERETWRAAHGDSDPPGAEPMAAFNARVRRALESLPDRFPGHQAVAVVTHGGPVGILLRMLADGTLPVTGAGDAPEVVRAGNCSIMELIRERTTNSVAWRVACVNDVRHLDGLATETDSG
jgi:broad specificity phosphatase PhoE